jgi:hypothetical protein
MSTSTIIAIVVAAVAFVGVLGWYTLERRAHTRTLRAQYGSEYDRAVGRTSDRHAAEAELVKRQARVDHFDIRPLLPVQRELFAQEWHDLQEMFVENPGGAVSRADILVVDVMRMRGYPVTNFEQRAADLSVHHAPFVQNYRAARDIAERRRLGSVTTEELRRAIVYYRGLFEDLLGTEPMLTDRPVERVVERDVVPSDDRRDTIDLGDLTPRKGSSNRVPVSPPKEIR